MEAGVVKESRTVKNQLDETTEAPGGAQGGREPASISDAAGEAVRRGC